MSNKDLLADQWYRRLLYIRQCITNVEKKIKNEGVLSLTSKDFSTLKRVLEMAAYHAFDDEGIHYRESKVGIAVRHLRKPDIYDKEIAEMATELYERWENGNFAPGPVFGNEDDEFTSADESEEEARGASPGRGELMKGIKITTSKNGGRTYALDPKYPRADAAVFGSNGLSVGDWWPYQICALRDGAHGSRMGGIHGRSSGAYSVVISGNYDDSDFDLGDTVYYSGSRGAEEPDVERKEAVLTSASKSLMMSKTRGKPVRLLRSSRCKSEYAPRVGIRYDGLYNVVQYSQQETNDGIKFWRFTLKRVSGQVPIDRSRPNLAERKEFSRMTQDY